MAAILLALTAPRLSLSLRFYFFVEFAASAWMLAYLHYYGFTSSTYTIVYMLGSLASKFAGVYLIGKQGWHPWELLMAGSFATVLGLGAYFGLDGVGAIKPEIVLPEGAVFVFLGMALGFRAPYGQDRVILVPLAVLWLLLGAFDFGLVLHPSSETWGRISQFGSYWLVIAAFGWIGFRGRLSPSRSG